MPLKVYNTITRREEEFKPLNPPNVSMYVCGITPYDETHIGHGRAYVTFDVIRRYLEHLGYKVNYVQNITDIDDKIINKAKTSKVSIREVAKRYTDSYFDVMDKLNVKRATRYPKATENIGDMVKVIDSLVKKGYAYVVSGQTSGSKDVYFEVAKFKDYGKLSRRKLEDMEAGARVEINEKKRNPLDFALWKGAKEGEPSWDSPWGKGRPGWHIECSIMSTKYLGETFDLHGGGLDLIFPHHENEIAQTEAYTGKPFVKYWIHNGFVTVNKEKMSKSLGNFFTLRDIFKKFSPEAVRLFLLSTHYRHPINFSDEQLRGAKEALTKIREAISDFELYGKSAEENKQNFSAEIEGFKKMFIESMDADFNTAGAIGQLFELINFTYENMKDREISGDGIVSILGTINDMLGILGIHGKTAGLPGEITDLIRQRDAARLKRDFKESDRIRGELQKRGYIVKDTPSGTSMTSTS